MRVSELSSYLDSIFTPTRFTDLAFNGLEICSADRQVKRVGLCVDVTLEAMEKFEAIGVDFIITHHGLLYGGIKRLVSPYSGIISKLLANQISVYVSHLPMDAHPEFSHSRIIANRVGLADLVSIPSESEPYGVLGKWPRGKQLLEDLLTDLIGEGAKKIRKFGPDKPVLNVGVLSGSGGGLIYDAPQLGMDILVTGEAKYSQIVFASNLGVDLWCFGHHNTEVFGLRALAEHLKSNFDFDLVEMVELSLDD